MSKLANLIASKGGLSGLISFGPLEGLLSSVIEQQNELANKVQQLEQTVAGLATKTELGEVEGKLSDKLKKHDRQLDKLEISAAR